MDDLISRKQIMDEAKRLSGPMTGDGWDNWGVYALIERQPSVPAVPLEPLARWITENLDPRCDCDYCFNEDTDFEDRECCNCPKMSEEQVKEKLEKWMEEQHESN